MTTVRCPHCDAGYPLKAIWIGRPLRCARCDKLFRVRADGGVADMPDDPASSAQTATGGHAVLRDPLKPATAAFLKPVAAQSPRTVPSVTPSTVPSKAPSAAPLAGSPPVPASPAAAPRSALGKHKLTAEQEEARREMSRALAEVTTRAEEAVKAAPSNSAPEGAAKQTGKQAKKKPRRSGDILVVGEGERDHRNLVSWLIGSAVVVGLVVACVLLAGHHGAAREALRAYTVDVSGLEAHTPLRLKRIQDRAWLPGARALLSLGSVSFESTKHLKTAAAKPALAILSGHVYLLACDAWVPADAEQAAASAWRDKKNRADNLAALASAGIAVITRGDLAKRLDESGVDKEAAEMLMGLLPHEERLGQDAAQRIGLGEVPDEIQVIGFSGSDGIGLVPSDHGYSYPVVRYEGRLLRFEDKDWPRSWRVLDLRYLDGVGDNGKAPGR